jgi:hypothetical protein
LTKIIKKIQKQKRIKKRQSWEKKEKKHVKLKKRKKKQKKYKKNMGKATVLSLYLLEYYLILDFYMRYIWCSRIGEGYI